MKYISDDEVEKISFQVEVRPFSTGYRIKEFSSGLANYNKFLKNYAQLYSDMNISQTHLIVNKTNGDIIGYMSLCNDTIKLLDEEKLSDKVEDIKFSAIPALKIGQLAISKKYRESGIHYGSFLLEIAKVKVYRLNSMGVACRYLTIDADIENKDDKGRDVTNFYIKNGFKNNRHEDYENLKTVSMRYDIFGED